MSTAILRELGPAERARASAALGALEMNTLFARAVLNQEVPGRAYANAEGTTFYVVHGYGMSLLFGEPCERVLREVLRKPRDADEWLQVAPNGWAAHVTGLASPLVETSTRINFAFSAERYLSFRAALGPPPYPVVPAGASAFETEGSVVPRRFWRDAARFEREGAAFALLSDGAIASLAFSAFVTTSALEIGIETAPAYRGQGLAKHACAALIDDCLTRNLEPVWACRLENAPSHRLAETLGFEPIRRLPYFRLHATAPQSASTSPSR